MIYTAGSIDHKTHIVATVKPSYYFSQYQAEKIFCCIILLSCFFPSLTTIMVFPIPMNMPNSPYQANPINGIFMRAMNTPIQTSHQCLIGNQWYSLKFARAHWWARIREDLNRKKTFAFGHCPNHLDPPPWPQFGQLGPLFLEVEIQDLKVSLELRILYVLYIILYICNLKNS